MKSIVAARVRISKRNESFKRTLAQYCPLHEALYGDSETVRRSVERKIADFRFYCGNRAFNSEQLWLMGLLKYAFGLKMGVIDCAVIACERGET